MKTMADRLREARVNAGFKSASEAATALGVAASTYRAHENGQNDYDAEAASLYGRKFGVSAAWLLMNDGSPPEPRRLSLTDELREEEEERNNHGRSDASAFAAGARYEPRIAGAIPELDVLAGAGEGAVGEVYALAVGDSAVSGHRVIDEWKLSEQWLRSEVHASPNRSIIVPVVGDSMEPSYRHGDRVIVDLTQDEFLDGTVFLVSVDDSAPSIKRLVEVYETQPKRITVVSDNPSIPNRDVRASLVRILGRVVGKVSRQ